LKGREVEERESRLRVVLDGIKKGLAFQVARHWAKGEGEKGEEAPFGKKRGRACPSLRSERRVEERGEEERGGLSFSPSGGGGRGGGKPSPSTLANLPGG